MTSRPVPARPTAPPYPLPSESLAGDLDAAHGVHPAGTTAGGYPEGDLPASSVRAQAEASWAALYQSACAALGDRREARFLLEEAAGQAWAALSARAGELAPPAVARHLERLVARRRCGEPLQHVLAHWSFRTVDLLVDGRALVPRPETEVVVELALAALDERAASRSRPSAAAAPGGHGDSTRLLAADLGTGGGAIACALATERRDLDVVAVDRSAPALELAAANVARLDGEARRRVRLLRADWYGAFAAQPRGGFDVVVANPPYLADRELAALDPVVRDYEPREALVSGPSGLECIGAVIAGAPAALAPAGVLVVEIAPKQAGGVQELAHAAGASAARVERDLAGRQRVLVARW